MEAADSSFCEVSHADPDIPLNVVINSEGKVDEVILGANTNALKSTAERLANPTRKPIIAYLSFLEPSRSPIR
jgi:hypothetical protein